ncbi:MAG: hypothetical protein F6J93_30480 [Oscillatoria sp. SIO1A7]|nr:hypothetical protein [Oscillatoria sp. SIO1A7]
MAHILDYTESLIDPAEKPEDIASLYNLKNQLVRLKGQKSRRGDGKIHVGVSQLRQAFNAHLVSAQRTQGISKRLLLFYAVECGLKSIFLRQRNLRTTNDIEDRTLLSEDGHNLARWINEVGVPEKELGEPPFFHLAKGGANLDTEKAHQVWRHGVGMNSRDERLLVEWLEKICDWIKENINR